MKEWKSRPLKDSSMADMAQLSSDFGVEVSKKTLQVPAPELAALLRVSSLLGRSLEVDFVLQAAIESAVEVLGLDMGVIYTFDGEELFLGAATPTLSDDLPDEHRRARLQDHPSLERCLRDLRPMIIPDARFEDLSDQERVIVESANLRSALFVPLVNEGHAIGVLIVHSRGRVREFTDIDMTLCRVMSHQISLALTNAQLFSALRQTTTDLADAYDATLKGWSRALDLRDHETGGHTERVADLTVHLARKIGVPEAELVHVRRGALLHDIGKMAIPDRILHKPGPLSEREWEIMSRHPEYAREMLHEVRHLAPALDIPYCHHERWNGSGYPRGLRGEEIPFLARVFAVVDVYDALLSDRPYRKPWTREGALSHIRENAGVLYDSKVVKAFLEMPLKD